ncbi:MAG: oxaloacetate decarboxylase subunit alpha [Gammaproteobacteria bacterium]|nr:oxaloacetate decarboxylase subunit alpha [Gammaproteobacteria bacterium]OUU09596.1 MAG: oxaloacetate decarboxylase subunit alpha [Gammaproteobacteria bacterium TMED34]
MSITQLGITDVVLRDAHQSLLATRFRIDDMLPMAEKLDQVGYWSLESWGGATFDACIRYLGEDPWDRIRTLKAAMPNTPQQMLLRGQNLLGYRHYADDVVARFVDRAATAGIDVFRIFDAMNDVRNLETAIQAALKTGKHAQGTIAYTVSPVHTIDMWVEQGQRLESMGAMSLCIKDMAGLLKPYVAYELVTRLKATVSIPVHMHCHATTGISTTTYLKAIEAGIDNVDTAISSMSMTYGHSATESLVAILADTERDTGLDLLLLEEISAWFRDVRKRYGEFEGSLRGVDSRILVAQVPGGMLTNLESQLKEQSAEDRLDEVLGEIPEVRRELGYLPLVTPTSQIVGTQAVINVMMGERYANVTRETEGVLRGEYGATPAPVDDALKAKVLAGDDPITCRPADLIDDELLELTTEFEARVSERGWTTVRPDEDVLTFAMFPQVAEFFFEHRGDKGVFEAAPSDADVIASAEIDATPQASLSGPTNYQVTVDGHRYHVEVSVAGEVTDIGSTQSVTTSVTSAPPTSQGGTTGDVIPASLAGNVVQVHIDSSTQVNEGDVVMVLEAMKMETEVKAPSSGTVTDVFVTEGGKVAVGDPLFALA